jgi:hypothetical protein
LLGRDVSLMSLGAYVFSNGESDVGVSYTAACGHGSGPRVPYRCWYTICSALNRHLVSGRYLWLWSCRRVSWW